MIYNVRQHNLRNNELLQFLNDVLKACNQYSTEPMKLAVVIAVLLTDTNEFDKLFKLNPASAITQELSELDFQRDNCLRGIHAVMEAYCLHFLTATQNAAKRLLASMDKYGKSIHLLNYPAETSTVKSLMADWTNTPVLASDLTLLSLNPWVTELSSKNTLFNDKYVARADEKATAPQVKTYDARKKAFESYKKLVLQIEAGATYMGDQSFDHLINLINQLVVKYNVIADSHIGDPEEEVPGTN